VTLGNKVQVVDPKEIGHDLGADVSGSNGANGMGVGGSAGGVSGNGVGGASGAGGAHVFRFQTHIPYPTSTLRAPLTLAALHAQLVAWLPELPITLDGDEEGVGSGVVVRTLRVTLSDTTLDAAWEWTDESLAMYVLCVVRKILLDFVSSTPPTLTSTSLPPAPTPLPPNPNNNNVDTTSQKEQLMCYE
jgi:hypothetical protein